MKLSLIDFELLGETDFSVRDVSRLIAIAKQYQAELLAKWEEYHGKKR